MIKKNCLTKSEKKKILFNSFFFKSSNVLLIHLTSGNPDGFHSNYITIMDFIKKLEDHMTDYCVNEFRASKLLQSFIHRWNLPVYFQIRFQEIGGPVEEACQDMFALVTDLENTDNFHLNATNAIMNAVRMCWMEKNVFLKPLTQKFWKLTLQIVARYLPLKYVVLSILKTFY